MQLFRVLRVNNGVSRVATTARVLRRPIDETIDGDGSETIDKDSKEKAGRCFQAGSMFPGIYLTNTLREAPHCACVSIPR